MSTIKNDWSVTKIDQYLINWVYTKEFDEFFDLQALHSQTAPFQIFIKFLNTFRFSDDLMCNGNEFHIFGPKLLKLFSPYLTWFILGTSRFNLYLFRTGRFDTRNWNKSFMKEGFRSFKVLKISIHRTLRFLTFKVHFSDLFSNSS